MTARASRRMPDLFRDEEGFTTTSMVLSMLITLALVFTAAQVYRVNSAAAEVQDVADAAALSAQNQVAEYMVVAQFCDSVVLSLSLSGMTVTGLGVAALCTPPTMPFAEGLITAGRNIIRARDDFASRAQSALDKLQEALPFFAAACAASVAAANNADSDGSSYLGVAILVPSTSESVKLGGSGTADELFDDIDEKADDIRQKAQEAEEATKEANEAKQRAFTRDCGDDPGYCMRERAASLVGLSGSANPIYQSVDSWSFSVPLERAKSYYAQRRYSDQPDGNSPADLARCELRKRFYRYAYDVLSREGYVHESADSFEAHFPHLPKNVSEMRQTVLYTEAVYPVTESDDGEVMHAWDGCPGAAEGIVKHESIAYWESNEMQSCPYCGFSAESMGNVAAASSSIENGFEYHYEAVAREAELYQDARKRADEPKKQVEEEAGELFEEVGDNLADASNRRIEVSPPGRYGAVALVVNMGSTSVSGGFASGFVSARGTLGPRVAISAATLVAESSDEGRTVLNSLLDGLREQGGAAVGAAGIALDVWSHVLSCYADGMEALLAAVESGLNSLPLVGESGLGTWAADELRSAVEKAGLQPAELQALKPVLVNSAHVAAKGEGRFASGLISIKQQVIAHPLYSTDLFSSLLTDAEKTAVEGVRGLDDSIQIASIELLGEGGPSIPITIPLPPEAKQYGIEAIQSVFARLQSLYVELTGVRIWE